MRKVVCITLLAGLFLFSGMAEAKQVFKKNELISWDRQNVAGGKGTLAGKFSFKRDQAVKEHAIKEIGWMTLMPGESIGLHKHESNEDAYIIISGTGMHTDSEGKEEQVGPGDITLARKGESHALANTGTEPLVFLDVIAQQ